MYQLILALLGVSTVAYSAQIAPGYPLSDHGHGHNLGYLPGFGSPYQHGQPLGHLGFGGGYSNLGLNYGGYGGIPSNNFGRVPTSLPISLPLNRGLRQPLGYPGHHIGHHPNGLTGYGGGLQVAAPLLAGHGADFGTGYSPALHPGHAGFGAFNRGGLIQNGGTILPYGGGYGGYGGYGHSTHRVVGHPGYSLGGGQVAVPKEVLTSNEVVIAHGNAGSSRQWMSRLDRN